MIDLVYANLAILDEPKTRVDIWYKYTGIYHDNRQTFSGCGEPEELYDFVKRSLPEYYKTLDLEKKPKQKTCFELVFCRCCLVSFPTDRIGFMALPFGAEIICPECGQVYQKINIPKGDDVYRDFFEEVMDHHPAYDEIWWLYERIQYREFYCTPNFPREYLYYWMANNWDRMG